MSMRIFGISVFIECCHNIINHWLVEVIKLIRVCRDTQNGGDPSASRHKSSPVRLPLWETPVKETECTAVTAL